MAEPDPNPAQTVGLADRTPVVQISFQAAIPSSRIVTGDEANVYIWLPSDVIAIRDLSNDPSDATKYGPVEKVPFGEWTPAKPGVELFHPSLSSLKQFPDFVFMDMMFEERIKAPIESRQLSDAQWDQSWSFEWEPQVNHRDWPEWRSIGTDGPGRRQGDSVQDLIDWVKEPLSVLAATPNAHPGTVALTIASDLDITHVFRGNSVSYPTGDVIERSPNDQSTLEWSTSWRPWQFVWVIWAAFAGLILTTSSAALVEGLLMNATDSKRKVA